MAWMNLNIHNQGMGETNSSYGASAKLANSIKLSLLSKLKVGLAKDNMLNFLIRSVIKETNAYPQSSHPQSLNLAIILSCLIDIILCRSDFDYKILKQREKELKGFQGALSPDNVSHYDYHLTKMIFASTEAKKAGRNPDNIKALLIYVISHVNMGKVKGPICPKNGCGLPVDEKRQHQFVRKVEEKGYQLDHISSYEGCRELIGTHLTREQVSKFAGHDINFSAQQRRIKRYYDQIETH